MAIHMGYMGSATIGTTKVMITSSSLNPAQAIEAPELVMGDFNKRGVNYGKIEVGGNIAGPVAEDSITDLVTKVETRVTDGDKLSNEDDIEIFYYKLAGRKFTDCQINSLQISVTAGDVAQFTVDFMGLKAETLSGTANIADCQKLVTWDKCTCTGAFPVTQVQSYTFTYGNALQRIYKIASSEQDLFPAEILAGIRDITGSLSFYAENAIDTDLAVWPTGKFGADKWDDYEATTDSVSFTCGPVTIGAKVMYSRGEANAQTGPMIYTVNFVGVCEQ